MNLFPSRGRWEGKHEGSLGRLSRWGPFSQSPQDEVFCTQPARLTLLPHEGLASLSVLECLLSTTWFYRSGQG